MSCPARVGSHTRSRRGTRSTWPARSVLKPIADGGRPGRLNRPLFKALAEHGLLRRLFSDGRAIDLCLIREALARACTDAETAFGTQGLGAYPILHSGADSLRDEW